MDQNAQEIDARDDLAAGGRAGNQAEVKRA